MTEWEVVGVIIVLVGLIASLVKPVVGLNASITKLNDICLALEKNLSELANKNSQAHERLWHRSEEHDARLQDHETRLVMLEKSE